MAIDEQASAVRKVRGWRVWLALLSAPASLAIAFGVVAALARGTLGLEGEALVAHLTAVAAVPTTLAFLAVLGLTWRLAGADGWSLAALGWTKPPRRDVGLALVAAPTLWLLHVFLVYPQLVKVQPAFDPSLRSQALGPLVMMLSAAIVAEDTLLRGYALRALTQRHGVTAAVCVTSVAGALVMPQPGWWLKLWALGLGLVLSLLRLASRSLWPVLVTHAALAVGPRLSGL
ncbi:MAG: CPBP family glutamic-type intramembrane protease [Myxococcota bacterium]